MQPKQVYHFTLFLLAIFALVAALPTPAFAYGDPSGGYLFQLLTPLAAVFWGGWLILAGRIRRGVGKVIRWTRSPAQNDAADTALESQEMD